MNRLLSSDQLEVSPEYVSQCCDAGIIGEPDRYGFARCGTCLEMSKALAINPEDEEVEA